AARLGVEPVQRAGRGQLETARMILKVPGRCGGLPSALKPAGACVRFTVRACRSGRVEITAGDASRLPSTSCAVWNVRGCSPRRFDVIAIDVFRWHQRSMGAAVKQPVVAWRSGVDKQER